MPRFLAAIGRALGPFEEAIGWTRHDANASLKAPDVSAVSMRALNMAALGVSFFPSPTTKPATSGSRVSLRAPLSPAVMKGTGSVGAVSR
ncbi:hypothetical protein [Mesorhizobium sp. BR1-1-14]|uniref:hypothetical protein n=1 Tax=Mesorhizobium sp. BR1-1-14 TaxID=2876655 RepID=UPI001CD05119|nr:hypothetical protein [Mesorhizobium sp. BR1-1-14]MBZ9959325.1 hypothetical protein [Mesorhizobium sp. BR1-1-14]